MVVEGRKEEFSGLGGVTAKYYLLSTLQQPSAGQAWLFLFTNEVRSVSNLPQDTQPRKNRARITVQVCLTPQITFLPYRMG